ncbi:MAG: type II toxin-antitoxin system VapC family toxin [Verrucomicrobiota bacterium]|jgi:predicted nucleic acid-binding protein
MAWVVDTCLLIDVAEADPRFGVGSARFLDRLRPDGLIICPVSYVELAPVFAGDETAQHQFLNNLAVSWQEPRTTADTREARKSWNRYVAGRRAGPAPRRPLADVLIGAFATRFQGILTRNEADFRQVFPTLKVLVP